MSELAQVDERLITAGDSLVMPDATAADNRDTPDLVSCEPLRLRVLVAGDDAGYVAVIERCLSHMIRHEPQITLAGTPAAARFAVAADELDIVIVIDGVDPAGGLGLLQAIVASGTAAPCILITSPLTSDVAAKARALAAVAALDSDDVSPQILETVVLQALRKRAIGTARRPRARGV